MAISIPIISEFDGSGISKAKQEFKQLEGAGAKAGYAIKKAAVPAGLALAGLAAAGLDAAKAAMEDEQAQAILADTLRKMTGATDDVIASTEDWISEQGRLLGVADDDLRPALAKLTRQTMDVAEAQKATKLAMDISAATGKDLSTVTTALEKAYGGNLNALAKLDPSLRGIGDTGTTTAEAMQILNDVFGGQAEVAANTAQGGMKRLTLAMSETKESIGAALLPVIEKLLPFLQRMAEWAQKNPQAFTIIAAAIGAIAAAIMAVNIAMSLNPFSLIAAGIAAVVVGLAVAYNKFEGFRKVVNTVMNGIIGYFEFMANAWRQVINLVIRGINLVKPGKDIPLIGEITFGRIGDAEAVAGALGARKMATGGIVTGPTLALIGEAGPEAVVPLDKAGAMGGVTINVHGGDPNAVVDALRRYMRQNGSVPIRTSTVY